MRLHLRARPLAIITTLAHGASAASGHDQHMDEVVISELVLGLDTQRNEHRNRSSMNQTLVAYESVPRIADAEFTQTGIYAEVMWELATEQRINAGLLWRALASQRCDAFQRRVLGECGLAPHAGCARHRWHRQPA